NGPSDASSVVMTDAIPANTTFVSEVQTTGPVFSCTTPAVGGTGTVSCTLATLLSGASATFTLTVHINSGTSGAMIVNTANVSSATTDPNPGNSTSPATTTVTAVNADISVVKTAAATAQVGANLSYDITVTNNGPSDSGAVTLTDVLPPNMTFVSES